jgi:hypothetical protein
MKSKKYFIIIILFFITFVNAQEVTVNAGLDTTNIDRKEIIKLWENYINSKPFEVNNNPNWCEEDKKRYNSYDLLKSEGFLNPSIYAFQLDSKILSITKKDDSYIIKSAFIYKENLDIYAIINVVAKKVDGKYFLTNFQPIITQNWKTKTIGNITYHFFPEYTFDENKALKANKFLEDICLTFNLKTNIINYYICKDCDDIFRVKGFDYVITMGNGNECGFYDAENKIIYATQLAGENHKHELTHIINDYFPNANELLLTGLSAYWGEESAHKGKPLLYSVKRVNEYLKNHPEIDLNKPNDFWKLDEDTNPQYVIGAIICDMAFEKGGITMLKDFLNNSKSLEEFLLFIEKKLNVKNGELDKIIRQKIEKISKENKFDNAKLKVSTNSLKTSPKR